MKFSNILIVVLFTFMRIIASEESQNKVFHSFALRDLKGNMLFSKNLFNNLLENEFLVFSYWSTECIPCRIEMPALEKIAHLNPNMKLYFININPPHEEVLVRDFIEKTEIINTILKDTYQISAQNNGICYLEESGTKKCRIPHIFITTKNAVILGEQKAFTNEEELFSFFKNVVPGILIPPFLEKEPID